MSTNICSDMAITDFKICKALNIVFVTLMKFAAHEKSMKSWSYIFTYDHTNYAWIQSLFIFAAVALWMWRCRRCCVSSTARGIKYDQTVSRERQPRSEGAGSRAGQLKSRRGNYGAKLRWSRHEFKTKHEPTVLSHDRTFVHLGPWLSPCLGPKWGRLLGPKQGLKFAPSTRMGAPQKGLHLHSRLSHC